MSLEYREEMEAAEAVPDEMRQPAEVVPAPLYTYGLLVAIAAVFSAQLYAGISNEQAFAAAFNKPEFSRGSYWLILTGATLHGSILHILMNGYALFSFGRLIELLSNRAHLAIVYLLSAIGGGILSLVFNPVGSSVGASGAIVGLLTYLAVYAFRRRKFISPEFRKSLLINIGFILVFGLVLFRQIDNFGHIGGMIVGAVYGFAQIPSDEHVDPRQAGSAVETTGIVSLGIYLAACVFSILITLGVA